MPGHQIHGLGRSNRSLQTRRKQDADNLDYSMRGFDSHIRSVTNRISGRLVEEGKQQRIVRTRFVS